MLFCVPQQKERCVANVLYMAVIVATVNVLKFQMLVSCQKGLDKQSRPSSDCFFRSSLIKVLLVCYSEKHFVNFSLDNKDFT